MSRLCSKTSLASLLCLPLQYSSLLAMKNQSERHSHSHTSSRLVGNTDLMTSVAQPPFGGKEGPHLLNSHKTFRVDYIQQC